LFDLKVLDSIAKIAHSKTELDRSNRFEKLHCTLNTLQIKSELSNKYVPLLRWALDQSNNQEFSTSLRWATL